MGLLKWLFDSNRNEYYGYEKKTRNNGGSEDHHFWTKDRNRDNHSHVVVNKDRSGKMTSAHSNTYKYERKN